MEDFPKSDSVSSDKKPLGELLVECGLISISQIGLALQEQKQNKLRIGEILVSHGWIKQKTVDFFAEQWHEILQEDKKKPTAYYFQLAGLLDSQEVEAIMLLQKTKYSKVRFHRLAMEEGYLKQTTVDFFLAHIFNIYNPNSFSVVKPYEVLKQYIQGERDFSNVDLSKAPLMGISLRGIKLNGSNLRKADLSKTNLSNSSLVKVNLALAIFTQAILIEADFTSSLLTRANFQRAHLEKANFQSAILHEVDFQFAYLAQADFSGADLSYAKLPSDYPYEVYYDQYTIFDRDFEPKLFGWKNKNEF